MTVENCVACGVKTADKNGYKQALCEDCHYINTCRREVREGEGCGEVMYFLYSSADAEGNKTTFFRCSEHGEVQNTVLK